MANCRRGVTGEYGPELKALLVSLKYVAGTSLPRAHEFVEHCGVVISPATVSNIVRDAAELFQGEKEEIFRAGLAATTYQHIDDTFARVGGEFWHTHLICNPFHSTYFTTPHKDRLTILDLLQGEPRTYRFNDLTQRLLEEFRVPLKWRQLAAAAPQDRDLSDGRSGEPDSNNGVRRHGQRAWSVCARRRRWRRIGHGRTMCGFWWATTRNQPSTCRMISGCAGFTRVGTTRNCLRWCRSMSSSWRRSERVTGTFTASYRNTKVTPTPAMAERLQEEFDRLFATRTGYEALDERIAMTGKKKGSLLTVLAHPETPLNNNPAELGERVAARRRDVSLHSAKAEGARRMDTLTSIVQTAKKLAVNGYEYLRDRISGLPENALLGESDSPAVAASPHSSPLPITHRPASCRPRTARRSGELLAFHRIRFLRPCSLRPSLTGQESMKDQE